MLLLGKAHEEKEQANGRHNRGRNEDSGTTQMKLGHLILPRREPDSEDSRKGAVSEG